MKRDRGQFKNRQIVENSHLQNSYKTHTDLKDTEKDNLLNTSERSWGACWVLLATVYKENVLTTNCSKYTTTSSSIYKSNKT